MFPPYKYIITRILRNVNKNIRKIRKNSRDFHTTKLNLPTGALDTKAARLLMEKLQEVNQVQGRTILMVTHDPNAASFCSRILFIQDGVIFHELRRKVPTETREEFYARILQVMAQMGGGSANVL